MGVHLRLAGLKCCTLLLLLFTQAATSTDARGQDVELLGERYGTRPPASYYELLRENPDAFQFRSRSFRRDVASGGGVPDPFFDRARVGASEVRGTYRFPLLLLQYADSPDAPPFSRDAVQREFFDGPNSRYATIPEYYDEVSGGRVTLVGEAFGWIRSGMTQELAAGGVSGLGGNSRIGQYITSGLAQADSLGIDWGQFDNDGPDGVPNSGDDDGFVDVLAVMHPTQGAECDGDENSNRIWSHRWSLNGATRRPFVTSTPSSSVSNSTPTILIDNYTIQPVMDCGASELNEIGVFAHELGHGFGLPDLYAVGSGDHAGVGRWGLMASGSWGCDGQSPQRPCHMTAWSKAILGWVDVEVLGRDRDHGTLSIPPVTSSGRVLRVDGDDSRDTYLLLENRVRQGFDATLLGEGLLVWQIDQGTVSTRWPSNTVNTSNRRMGVWLRQADGRNDLGSAHGGRGDRGDPFPGSANQNAFHASSSPASVNVDGQDLGVTLTNIERVGQDVRFRLITGLRRLTMQIEGGGSGADVRIDGIPVSSGTSVTSAPFKRHLLEASGGVTVGPGVRVGFSRWEDGSGAIREFTMGVSDSSLVATYGTREVQVAVDFSGPAEGVEPGFLRTTPGSAHGWVQEGSTTVISAIANVGFAFRDWSGDLAGFSNPATLVASNPIQAGAAFDVIFTAAGNPEALTFRAGIGPQSHRLVASEGTQPFRWTVADGQLPEGMTLIADGWIQGSPTQTGTFPLEVQVQDKVGLQAQHELTLQVQEPAYDLKALIGPFTDGDTSLSLWSQKYLDEVGNQNGSYDLGDFRAFIRSGGRVLDSQQEVFYPFMDVRAPRPLTTAGAMNPRGEQGGRP